MRGLALGIVFALVAGAVVTAPAHAQRRRTQRGRATVIGRGRTVGPHVGYNFDASAGVLGAQASFPLAPQVDLYPSFDFYTVSGRTLWALNGDLRLRPPARYRYWYVGSGLNITHASSGGVGATKAYLNLLAGLEGRMQTFQPYAEARLTVGNGSSFQIVGGLSFPIH